jgi:hypothetical protein
MADHKNRDEMMRGPVGHGAAGHGSSGSGNGAHGNEYEREDLGTKGVFAFMVGLGITGIIAYFIVVGMYRFLDNYERSQQVTASPLDTSKGASARVITQEDVNKIFKDNGAPLLEVNERGQLRDFLMKQEDQLNSYGWIDEKAGIAHIPIERAMELTVEHGIPVYPQSQQMQANAGTSGNPAAAQQSSNQQSSSQQ